MAWLTVNVLAPVLLPLLLLGLAKTTPAGHRLQLMETVTDGQLSWFAITLSAPRFYDMMQNDAPAHRVSWCGYGMAGRSLIGMLSGVYAVVAAIKPTPILAAALALLIFCAIAGFATILFTSPPATRPR